MTTTPPKLLRLHNHPALERKLNLNIHPGHVVIDADVFLALVNIHGRYVSPNAKLSTTEGEEIKP
jgi:hypothetical protein